MATHVTLVLASTWFLYFIVYSILGWMAETVYCSVPQKHFVERGFMSGPYCPIYGFGAVIVLAILEPYFNFPLYIFLLGMAATTILEYLTSFIMEKLFHMRWWDYSNHKFNIKGRVCLLNSTLFGVMCLILTLFIHPIIERWIDKIPDQWLLIISGIVLAAFVFDFIYSVRAVLQLDKHLAKLREMEAKIKEELEELKEEGQEITRRKKEEGEEKFRQWYEENESKFGDVLEAMNQWKKDGEAKMTELKRVSKAKSEKLLASLIKPSKYQERRIMRSFPKLRHTDDTKDSSLVQLKESLKTWKKK